MWYHPYDACMAFFRIMNTERPNFEAKTGVQPGAVTHAIREKMMESPMQLRIDRVEDALSVLKGEKEAIAPKPPEPEPTESQKFWREMYRTGKLSPYQKDRPGISLQAVAEAWKNPETQGQTSRLMAVDLALRGGADKEYNQLGNMTQRLKRMTVMAGNVAPFMTFDIVTGIPSGVLFEYLDSRPKMKLKEYLENPDRLKDTLIGGAKKIIEVENDKVVTALGDIVVHKLTGEKGAWTHEAADKSADLLGTAAEDRFKDVINGPVLESLARFVYQIPVAGALIEQGYTRLSLLQEKSQLNKGIAKSFYMGIGLSIHLWRGLHIKLKGAKYKEKPEAPSARIAHWLWGKITGRQTNAPPQEA